MKIAICISGHFRDYKNTYQNYLNNLLIPLKEIGNVDIFIHTWDKLGPLKTDQTYRNNSNYLSEINIDVNNIKEIYNPNEIVVENYDKIKENFKLSNFTNKTCHNSSRYTEDSDILCSTPMFYKIWACNELKKDYENNNQFKYDCVVRYRPDLLIKYPLKFSQLDLGKCNVWAIYLPNKFFCDCFIIGNSNIMDNYSLIYKNLSILLSDSEYDDFMPEKMLWRNMEDAGFSFNGIDNHLNLWRVDGQVN